VYTTAGITDTRRFEFQLMENDASNCRGIINVKRLLHFVSLCAIGVLIFDVGIYLLAPRSLTAALPGYKKPMVPGSNARAGNAFYPQDYFVADAQTGFQLSRMVERDRMFRRRYRRRYRYLEIDLSCRGQFCLGLRSVRGQIRYAIEKTH
jgi:hypothetical protein